MKLAQFVLVTILACVTPLRSQRYRGRIEEPEAYVVTKKPQDVSGARSILGYDKYERQPVEHASPNTQYRYGNNWERFDKEFSQYNFRHG